MPILTITLEINDVERATLLNHIADRGGIAVKAPANGFGHATDEGEPDADAPAVDKTGIPWDARIHSGNKKLNADGTWRRMRGVTDDVFNRVTAELRAAVASAPAAPAVEAAPAAPTVEAAPPVPPAPAVPAVEAAPAFPSLPNPVDIAPPPPAPVTYDALIARYKELTESGKLTNDNYKAVYAAAGVTDANLLQTDESLRRRLMDEMNKL